MGGILVTSWRLVVPVVMLAGFLARSENSPDAYREITSRNAFGLKSRPASQQALPEAPPELPKVKLTGITTMLGKKQAVLKVLPSGGKKGQPTQVDQSQQPESYLLAEGQKEGNIEVLQIDERNGMVRLVNSGQEMRVVFEDEPLEQPSAATALTNPILARAWHTNRPMTMAAFAPPGMPGTTMPNRTYSYGQPPFGTTATNASSPVPQNSWYSAATNSLPQRAADGLTPEERAVLMQLQDQLNRENRKQPPPLPSATGSSRSYRYQNGNNYNYSSPMPANTPANPAPPRWGRPPLTAQ